MTTLPGYAELMALSHFSFQQAASSPEELVDRAAALGYQALAVTDECSVAGVVRAHAQARQHPGLQLLPGAVFTLPPPEGGAADGLFPGWRMVVLPRHLMGWGQLCRYITLARAAAPKGQYRADWPRPGSGTLSGCEVVLLPPRRPMDRLDAPENRASCAFLKSAGAIFDAENGSLWLGAVLHQQLDDDLWLMHLSHWSQASGLPLVALGGAVMHHRSRKPLHDVLTAIRLHRPVAQCGQALLPNAQAHLRTRLQLARVYPPELLAATLTLAGRCRFSLDELRYRYPRETVAPGETPSQTLARRVWAGAAWRYGVERSGQVGEQGDGAVGGAGGEAGADFCSQYEATASPPAPPTAPSPCPPEVHAQLTHELALIAELGYEMYFLTVHDLVRFARSRDILCQGRGSAANSAVCYCLGITEVDPARATLLFERFISRERDEPPDIDVDFEHQRREEVIQYIYAKYGRDRAALAATVISYRPRSALRDVGRALGVDERLIHAFCKEHPGMYGRTLYAERLPDVLARLGMDPVGGEHLISLWLSLAGQLLGVPRHLSQHVGGFVLTEGPLTRLVPIEPAAMDGRSIIQWDKDDLDAVGLMKVDVLALGMLTALRRALHLLTAKGLPAHTLAAIPPECPAVYAMVSRADTVGVFQIESRAQMSMLPRLRPAQFYDLVVQVAIVRPGPIQGGMVHPYLRRRRGLEPVVHLSPQLEQALGRTLGVPIFQEQVMQVVMLCAGFSAGEADELRRAMAAWKRKGGVDRFRSRVVQGMVAQGYPQDFAEAIFAQIEGFGEYGFPESHAASFALLAYASAWLKCHHPDVFLAALLNSQPMGFYTPSQLVQDAQRHGVQVLPVDVRFSDWDCTLVAPPGEAAAPHEGAPPAPLVSTGLRPVRLGLRLVKNFNENATLRLLQKREQLQKTEQRTWASVNELARLAGLNQAELDALAAADALRGLAGHRRTQVWAAAGAVPLAGLFRPVGADDDALPPSLLPEPTPAQDVVADHAATGLSLRAHPVSFLRPQLSALRLSTAAELSACPSGRLARACGIVTVRQQPGTASGVVFVTLEDETGTVNVIVWPALKARQRQELTRSRLMAVYGVWQRDDETGGQVRHLVAKRLRDLTPLLGTLQTQSRDFH